MKIVAIVKFKKYIANICIFYIVISKLNYWQKFSSIILLKINKRPKIGLYYIIFPLSLTINFKVEGSEEPLHDFQKVTKR